jgi:short-subunit dehydrogenase involved in D-alanine esterification of teichoic acids
MKLTKRTIPITGGTSGIGKEFALQLLARGNTIIVTGRDQQKLDEVRRAIRGIEAGQTEIRPGLSNVLNIASRLAPSFMFGQMINPSRIRAKAA